MFDSKVCYEACTVSKTVPISEHPLLSHHVARLCGCSPRTIRWAAKCGRLKGFRRPDTPKIWRFYRTDVEVFMAYRGHSI